MGNVPAPADDSHLHTDPEPELAEWRRKADHYWAALAKHSDGPYYRELLRLYDDATARVQRLQAMCNSGERVVGF
jgi:hypothetical protein